MKDMINHGAYFSKPVESANRTHLMRGLMAIAMILLCEGFAIAEFCMSEPKVAAPIAIIVQIPLFDFVPYAKMYLAAWHRKRTVQVNLHVIGTAQRPSVEDYYVLAEDEYGFLFVDKSDKRAAEDLMLIYEHSPVKKIVKDLFFKEM